MTTCNAKIAKKIRYYVVMLILSCGRCEMSTIFFVKKYKKLFAELKIMLTFVSDSRMNH